ncbi:cytochrome P450 [Amycolatopsis sp. NPDC088138]|uniref:cytochrome P450 n=1 Tax=Amycolatopsis sp. NPDC088138 TaxID=3363938 RepID=UPI0038302E44
MTDTETPAAATSGALPYDPWDPGFHADPYAVFRRIREESGSIVPTQAGVALLGFSEISAALADPKLGRGNGIGAMEGMMPTDEGPRRAFMFMDPPDHTRIRSLVSKSFTPRLVERIRPKAHQFAEELIKQVCEQAAGGVVDLAPAVFRPLGAYVMNTLMGVPDEHLEKSIELATDGGRGLDPEYSMPQEAIDARNRLRTGMADVGREMIALRRKEPADDLMSELVVAEKDGQRLTETEVLTTAMNIMLPGFSAPQAMMGLAAFALLRHPDQLAWFRANPDKAVASVEELLRFDTAVQIVSRTALADAEIGGVAVAEGSEVFMLLGAGHRDPAVYDDPDRLDLARPASRNLGFGHGIHFCVAAPVARLVSQVVLTALVRRDITLATDEPRTNGALAIRSLAELPVVLGAVR